MRVTYTSECKKCGTVSGDGAMTALTAERDAGSETVHMVVTYGRCCRDAAIKAAGIRFDANGNLIEETRPSWDAFLASESLETVRS